MPPYPNRQAAGQILAEHLRAYRNQKNTLVLALPRGGVPVAYEVAEVLQLPLDIIVARKLGVPGHEELAMGAIAARGQPIFNEAVIRECGVQPDEIKAVIEAEQKELQRREKAYRGAKPFPDLHHKTVILIDDGIATGATMRAAIQALRGLSVDRIVVAVPVMDVSLVESFERLTDELVAPLQPAHLNAVGSWYDDFSETEDEAVRRLLS